MAKKSAMDAVEEHAPAEQHRGALHQAGPDCPQRGALLGGEVGGFVRHDPEVWPPEGVDDAVR